MYEARRVHPIVFVAFTVLITVLSQALMSNVDVTHKILIFLLSFPIIILTLLFEFTRINLEAESKGEVRR